MFRCHIMAERCRLCWAELAAQCMFGAVGAWHGVDNSLESKASVTAGEDLLIHALEQPFRILLTNSLASS